MISLPKSEWALMHTKIATTRYDVTAPDLAVILSLVRVGNLAAAGGLLGMDPSTVFRSLQRIERGLGRSLFVRSRSGYEAMELAAELAEHAEQMETALEAARSVVSSKLQQVSGKVRITTTDTLLPELISPALLALAETHPLLSYELHTGNELASLTRRDADIAIRATRQPPKHLVGKKIGPIRVALYTGKRRPVQAYADVQAGTADWIAPDDLLPDHPSVAWRKRHFPKISPRYRVNSILSVLELVAAGLGVGIIPLFLAKGRNDLVQLTEALDECETDLWVLTHPETRHLRRVGAVYSHLAHTLVVP